MKTVQSPPNPMNQTSTSRIAQRSLEVTEAIKNGTAKIGTIEDLIADVFGDDEDVNSTKPLFHNHSLVAKPAHSNPPHLHQTIQYF